MPSSSGPPSIAPLAGRRFYLDARAERLSARIRRLGAAVELFLGESVTHVVSDDPGCGPAADPPASPALDKVGGRPAGYRSRTDAMLESAYVPPRSRSLTVLQQARIWNIPVWSIKKTEWFLNKVSKAVRDKVSSGAKRLRGSFLKFESSDRRNRAVYKEFPEWPALNLSRDHSGSPFFPADDNHKTKSKSSKIKDENSQDEAEPLDRDLRMTRKTGPRLKDRADNLPRQSGYCEICRISYSQLSDHERTASHVNFMKNCSNFLSLDALIDEGADVETFLKMNKCNISNNLCERRSLRNIIKVHQESEKPCNGNGDGMCKSMTLRNLKRSGSIETGHNLRSKGSSVIENENSPKISTKDIKKELVTNGSLSPRISSEKNYSKLNGKIEEKDNNRRSVALKTRSIRWRKPSPDSGTPPSDNQTYYKVVGMSTKLRSSNNYATQKEAEAAPPVNRHHCNGDAESGLIVKFRKVRRSELSVLSDEAENFMFPKKDESDSTDDEAETTSHKSRNTSSEVLTSSGASRNCKVKEEVLSGDDVSQDSCGSDSNKRRTPRRQPRRESQLKETPDAKVDGRRKRRSFSKSPEGIQESKTDAVDAKAAVPPTAEVSTVEKCLKWENGRLKTSPEVENLSFTFENVPSYEPWYDAYKRQDEGHEHSHNIAEYLGYYWKSPILPYEMGQLPPLKPNCCPLSQLRKPADVKSSPVRSYGTRGMKKKKIKIETTLNLSKRPRKSPREHASTLAILGSLVNKRKSKISSSDDSKSLPSITEEETSNDVPVMFKLPEIQVSESSKRLEEFFSSIVDNEEYDTMVENLENNVHFETTTEKPNVVELLENFDQCEIIENTVKEMQDNMKLGIGGRKRKGYRFKKKNNRTGWPAKKKLKKESASTAGSAGSSREASIQRDVAAETEEESGSMVLEETHICADRPTDQSQSVSDNHMVNEDVVASTSEAEDKKCKTTTIELSEGDDATSSSVRTIEVNSKDLQPIVRVQKIDTKVPGGIRGRRRLRSGARRRLRGRPAR